MIVHGRPWFFDASYGWTFAGRTTRLGDGAVAEARVTQPLDVVRRPRLFGGGLSVGPFGGSLLAGRHDACHRG